MINGSSFQICSPSSISFSATRPFPFFLLKYLTFTFGVHWDISKRSMTREEGNIRGSTDSGDIAERTSPWICKIFLVRFSLTVHSGYVWRRRAWTLEIPRDGSLFLREIRALTNSDSWGIVGIGLGLDKIICHRHDLSMTDTCWLPLPRICHDSFITCIWVQHESIDGGFAYGNFFNAPLWTNPYSDATSCMQWGFDVQHGKRKFWLDPIVYGSNNWYLLAQSLSANAEVLGSLALVRSPS